jgi:hypothetical protein
VSGAEWKHRPGFNDLLAALTPRPPFDVLIVSELSRIGRDIVRTPAAVMQIEEAGVEIRSYLNDAPISLATSRARSIRSSILWPPASSGGERVNGPKMRSAGAPRPAPSRAAESTATGTNATARAMSAA